jgi:ABC-type nitrate/sulfonate/bicarbonate transport system substrate-binding protein
MADKYINAHKDEAIAIYINEVKSRGAKLAAEDVKVMLFETERYGGPAFTKADLADLPATRDYLIKTGRLKSLAPLKDLVVTSFAEKAEANAK